MKTVEYQLECNGKIGTIRIGLDANARKALCGLDGCGLDSHEKLLRLGIYSDMKVIHERAFDDQIEVEAK